MNKKVDKIDMADVGSTSFHTSYDKGFNPVEEVTRVTADTLGRKNLAMAGKIAYIDNGAALYEAFKKSRLPKSDSSQSAPSRLLTMHKGAIADSIKDIERLVIVGGGSYESFMNQEMLLLTEIFAQDPKAPLKEIVMLDVSQESLADGHKAVEDISVKLGRTFNTLSIRSDFKNASGAAFDQIMTEWGSKKRDDIKSAVIMTGGTFGNLEGITSTEAFPINDVDEQMAHIGELVGIGSTAIFDHFTRMDSAESYYNSPELAAFMTNIPSIMQKYCRGLSNFRVNDPGSYNDPYFSYRARSIPNARLVTHQLIAESPQTAILKNGIEKVLTISDKYTVMVSLYPSVDDINRRPAANTGLESQFHVSSKDLVLHVYKKIGRPAVLFEDDAIMESTMTRGAGMSAGALGFTPFHNTSRQPVTVHAAPTV